MKQQVIKQIKAGDITTVPIYTLDGKETKYQVKISSTPENSTHPLVVEFIKPSKK